MIMRDVISDYISELALEYLNLNSIFLMYDVVVMCFTFIYSQLSCTNLATNCGPSILH